MEEEKAETCRLLELTRAGGEPSKRRHEEALASTELPVPRVLGSRTDVEPIRLRLLHLVRTF